MEKYEFFEKSGNKWHDSLDNTYIVETPLS
jgi:hypothetical protein